MKQRAINLEGVPAAPQAVGVMVLLDRSGSMASIQAAMESAFAEFVAAQQQEPGDLWLTLKQFDTHGPVQLGTLSYETTYDRTPIAQVGGLHLNPRGSTPLCDALYRFVGEARAVIDDPTDATEKLLVVCITDGGENASHDHTWAEVKGLLDGLENASVEVMWLGTSEAVREAASFSGAVAAAGGATAFTATAQGADYASGSLSVATYAMRAGSSAKFANASYLSSTAGEKILTRAQIKKLAEDAAQKDASGGDA